MLLNVGPILRAPRHFRPFLPATATEILLAILSLTRLAVWLRATSGNVDNVATTVCLRTTTTSHTNLLVGARF